VAAAGSVSLHAGEPGRFEQLGSPSKIAALAIYCCSAADDYTTLDTSFLQLSSASVPQQDQWPWHGGVDQRVDVARIFLILRQDIVDVALPRLERHPGCCHPSSGTHGQGHGGQVCHQARDQTGQTFARTCERSLARAAAHMMMAKTEYESAFFKQGFF
jgi:hypothetical protein